MCNYQYCASSHVTTGSCVHLNLLLTDKNPSHFHSNFVLLSSSLFYVLLVYCIYRWIVGESPLSADHILELAGRDQCVPLRHQTVQVQFLFLGILQK